VFRRRASIRTARHSCETCQTRNASFPCAAGILGRADWFPFRFTTTRRIRTPMATRLALPQAGNCRASLPEPRRTHWRGLRLKLRPEAHGQRILKRVTGQATQSRAFSKSTRQRNPVKPAFKELLKAWIASGALKVGSGLNPNRRGHDRPTVIVGNRVFEGVRDVENEGSAKLAQSGA
jgi:hypothetical protein